MARTWGLELSVVFLLYRMWVEIATAVMFKLPLGSTRRNSLPLLGHHSAEGRVTCETWLTGQAAVAFSRTLITGCAMFYLNARPVPWLTSYYHKFPGTQVLTVLFRKNLLVVQLWWVLWSGCHIEQSLCWLPHESWHDKLRQIQDQSQCMQHQHSGHSWLEKQTTVVFTQQIAP